QMFANLTAWLFDFIHLWQRVLNETLEFNDKEVCPNIFIHVVIKSSTYSINFLHNSTKKIPLLPSRPDRGSQKAPPRNCLRASLASKHNHREADFFHRFKETKHMQELNAGGGGMKAHRRLVYWHTAESGWAVWRALLQGLSSPVPGPLVSQPPQKASTGHWHSNT
uniref:Uncharacterized protein n=1 Tax=Paramormyrops kingsleyae TaxID=1676925 RepID=A0A3B3RZK6_9TELE